MVINEELAKFAGRYEGFAKKGGAVLIMDMDRRQVLAKCPDLEAAIEVLKAVNT